MEPPERPSGVHRGDGAGLERRLRKAGRVLPEPGAGAATGSGRGSTLMGCPPCSAISSASVASMPSASEIMSRSSAARPLTRYWASANSADSAARRSSGRPGHHDGWRCSGAARVDEVLLVGGHQPGHVVCRVADAQVGPAGHGGHAVAVDQEVVFVQVAVDHAGIEAPEGHVFHGVFPAAQQQRRDLARGGRLVQFVQPALAEFVGGVAGQIGVADQGAGKVVDGGQRRADLPGQAGRARPSVLRRCGSRRPGGSIQRC